MADAARQVDEGRSERARQTAPRVRGLARVAVVCALVAGSGVGLAITPWLVGRPFVWVLAGVLVVGFGLLFGIAVWVAADSTALLRLRARDAVRKARRATGDASIVMAAPFVLSGVADWFDLYEPGIPVVNGWRGLTARLDSARSARQAEARYGLPARLLLAVSPSMLWVLDRPRLFDMYPLRPLGGLAPEVATYNYDGIRLTVKDERTGRTFDAIPANPLGHELARLLVGPAGPSLPPGV